MSASSPVVCPSEWVEGPSRQRSGRLRAFWASWGRVSLPSLCVDGRIRPSLAAQRWGPDCYTGTVWRWAMALQFISCCSSATKAPSAHFSSVGALRKMDWLAGPSEEAKRVAKSLCSTWLLSYASLMKDIHKQSLGSFFCIRCLSGVHFRAGESMKAAHAGTSHSSLAFHFYRVLRIRRSTVAFTRLEIKMLP